MQQEAGQNWSCSSPSFLQTASAFTCTPQGPLPTTLLHPTSPVHPLLVMSSPAHNLSVTTQPLSPNSSPTLAAKASSQFSGEERWALSLPQKRARLVKQRVRGCWEDIVAMPHPCPCPRRDLHQLTAPREAPLPRARLGCRGLHAAQCVTTLRPALL